MSEEVPFKSMKITLSEEALEKLCKLKQGGAFRSDSATIEECIRTVDDTITDLVRELDLYEKQKPTQNMVEFTAVNLLKIAITRLSRFRRITMDVPRTST